MGVRGNCIIAQSGGPTSVINASAYGCIREFNRFGGEYTAFAGIYGIEGILQEKIVDTNIIPKNETDALRFLPSAAFGSNRHQLKDFRIDDTEYKKIFSIFEKKNIRYFFYIGGNDSMDTVSRLYDYSRLTGYDIKFCGVPKTIDNDLVMTDHCPGFGSAAKFVVTSCEEAWFDINTYDKTSIMLLEVMGRDAGWIALSANILRKTVPGINLLVYCPEKALSRETFLANVENALRKKDKLLIVVSEGVKNSRGRYLSENSGKMDMYGHRQLGGVGSLLEQYICEKITQSVKLLELGILQRCAAHCASTVDLKEAEFAGRQSVRYAFAGGSGFMTAFERTKADKYECKTKMVPINEVCNKIRHVPEQWLTSSYSRELREYLEPIIFDVREMRYFGISLSSFRGGF